MTEKTEQQKLEALTAALADLTQQEPNLDNIPHIKFKDPISGKGILWQGSDYTKQFVFQDNNLFSSENINLGKGKTLSINDVPVISEDSLGTSVTKSNLKEVGQLNGLIVNGSFKVNNYLVFDANSDRLGIGTDEPNSALTIVDDAVEIGIGARDYSEGSIGTFNNAPLHIVTGNDPKITISAEGDIQLGNRNNGDIKVQIHGSLGINVSSIDNRSKLHINGAIKFNDNIHLKGSEPPAGGSFTLGDIVWNSNPVPGNYVGWVCVKAGNPGMWSPFGEIR
jgi:hypothetical protein